MTDHVTEHVVMGYKLSSYSDTLVFGIICQRVEYKCEIDFLNLFDMIHIGVIFTDVHVLYLLTIYLSLSKIRLLCYEALCTLMRSLKEALVLH